MILEKNKNKTINLTTNMKTYNLDQPILDFLNEPLLNEDRSKIMANKILANVLGNVTSKEINDVLKSLNWGTQLYNTGTLSIDDSDLSKLKKFITTESHLIPILAGRIISMFDTPEETTSKK